MRPYTKEMEDASLATLGFMFAELVSVDAVLATLVPSETIVPERELVGV